MKIEHLAIWVEDLEKMRDFYEKYFQAKAGEQYHNPVKQFTSYFLTFPDGSTRIELMQKPGIDNSGTTRGFSQGIAHMAFLVSSKEEVRQQTERLRAEGYEVVSEPRLTGDGYYESAILDPEGNYIEICADPGNSD